MFEPDLTYGMGVPAPPELRPLDTSDLASEPRGEACAATLTPAVKPFHWINDQGDSLVSSKV